MRPWRTTLVFFELGDDHPGALVDALAVLSDRGINMTRIESRPRRSAGLGSYMFFLDLDGRAGGGRSPRGSRRCAERAGTVRVLGSYQVGAAAPLRRPPEAANRPDPAASVARIPRQMSVVSAPGPAARATEGPAGGTGVRGRVLVLNATYEPIHVCSVRRADGAAAEGEGGDPRGRRSRPSTPSGCSSSGRS